MYFKDKTEVYKIRLTVEQSKYVGALADLLNCSKSEIIRKMIESFRLGGKPIED